MKQFAFPTIKLCRELGKWRGWVQGGRRVTQLFPINNGSHTSTWPTSELNNEHVLGNT